MPRNGSGSYTPPSNTAYPAVNGVTLTAADYNALILDLAAAVTASLAADGQTPMTGNLNAGNNRITSLADASSLSDAATASDVQTGRLSYLTSVSGTNTITASLTGLAAYTTGQEFRFVAAGTNTGSVTLNINSIGAKAITRSDATALVAGEIQSGAVVTVVYDGTQFQLISRPAFTAQAWVSFTGLRSVGTTYTNTTGRPIQVNIRVSSAAGQIWTLTIGGAATNSYSNNGIDGTFWAVIPAGATYVLTGGTLINTWAELR